MYLVGNSASIRCAVCDLHIIYVHVRNEMCAMHQYIPYILPSWRLADGTYCWIRLAENNVP